MLAFRRHSWPWVFLVPLLSAHAGSSLDEAPSPDRSDVIADEAPAMSLSIGRSDVDADSSDVVAHVTSTMPFMDRSDVVADLTSARPTNSDRTDVLADVDSSDISASGEHSTPGKVGSVGNEGTIVNSDSPGRPATTTVSPSTSSIGSKVSASKDKGGLTSSALVGVNGSSEVSAKGQRNRSDTITSGSQKATRWNLAQKIVIIGLAVFLVLVTLFYSYKIATNAELILQGIKRFSLIPSRVVVSDLEPNAEYANISNSMELRIPDACKATLIMEVLILQMIPWIGFAARWLAYLVMGEAYWVTVKFHNKMVIGLLFGIFCAFWLWRSLQIAKKIKEQLFEVLRASQNKASRRRSMYDSRYDKSESEDLQEEHAHWTELVLWPVISLLIWSIGAMYGLAMADAFMYDNADHPDLQKEFLDGWSSAPHQVLAVVQTLHIKWLMVLSLCFGFIVNLGMAVSNINGKPMITAQIASFDALIQPLYAMKDPVTALHQDADRLLAVGLCRVFFEWIPRSFLQESLIMAHCSNIWELPFCCFSIAFSLIGVTASVGFSVQLSQCRKTAGNNNMEQQELSSLRKALLMVVAILSGLAGLAILVRLIAAEYCKGPWGFMTGCVAPCIKDVHQIIKHQ